VREVVGRILSVSDVSVRHAVVPRQFVFIPKRPEEAEKNCAGGEPIAEAAPEELARFGKCAVDGDGGEIANLHARRGAGKERKEREIEGVDQEENGGVNAKLRTREAELASERAEKTEKTDEDGRDDNGVDHSGQAASGQIGDRKGRFRRMEAKIFDDREIEFGLRNMNFDVLRGTNARDGARRDGGGDDLRHAAVKGQGRLGLPGIVAGENVVAARTINFETAGNLAAPFWFFGSGHRARSGGLGGRGCLAERAHVDVLITDRATLRTYLDHRLVLRCGPDWRTGKS
jgi:hypothetical protein